MSKYFSLEQAEQLLPEVERVLQEAVDLKREHEECGAALEEAARRIVAMGGMRIDHHQLLMTKARREASASKLSAAIESLEELGCQVKDLDTGLVDFPTLFRGVEVLLCWRLGERGIHFWHGVDEGFRGRRPIDRDFLENHRGHGPS